MVKALSVEGIALSVEGNVWAKHYQLKAAAVQSSSCIANEMQQQELLPGYKKKGFCKGLGFIRFADVFGVNNTWLS